MEHEHVNAPLEGVLYTQREGAYGIITRENGQIGIIETSTGYFLPGGGLEASESLENCLKRECLEEAAMEIDIERKLSIKSFYFRSTLSHEYMESKGHFYKGSLVRIKGEPCEEDHRLVWMDEETAVNKLYLENQRLAVTDYYRCLQGGSR